MSETTSTELVVIPYSGEVVDVENTHSVALAVGELQRIQGQINYALRQLREILGAHTAVMGTNTFHVPGLGTVEVKTRDKVTWDVTKLEEGLRAAGAPEELINEIIEWRTEAKVDARRADRAGRANPAYAEVVEAAKTKEPSVPTISIS